MHLNKECLYPDLSNLFAFEDYSQKILHVLSEIEQDASTLKSIISGKKRLSVTIGSYCETPRTCPFKKHCWKDIPIPSIFNIQNCKKKWDCFNKDLISIDSLSLSHFNSKSQKRALQSYQQNNRFFNKDVIIDLLKSYQYPLIFLDFEAIDFPIPIYDKTHPYQHIPFQFSCHIQQNNSSSLEHYEFIFNNPEDPRKSFIESLIKIVPNTGSVIVYNKTYEQTRLKELIESFPEYQTPLQNILNRLIDLLDIFKKGFYDPALLGSFSIKKVGPTILGKEASYKNLAISVSDNSTHVEK